MKFLTPCLALVALFLASCAAPPPQVTNGPVPEGGPFRLGDDVLAANHYDLLRGKRVGLITNQTSVNGSGTPTRVAMLRAGVHLTALYAPEHGIDGTVGAGKHFGNVRDRLTGLPVYSLYGNTRKPTPSMLAPIDVMVFDLQDIGVRSYTYISTMVVSMEACGENGKEFVVLDRPNPLGGLRVEGPPVSSSWKSFVSQTNVAYAHGMTAGELALMTCGEGWIHARPRVNVVKMQGWTRAMVWQNTGLHWYRTSPNIPNASSPLNYLATSFLGGSAGVDIGIGTENPFGYAGGGGVNPQELAARCRSWGFPGVSYEPYVRGHDTGVRLFIDPHTSANITALDVFLLAEVNRMKGGAPVGRMHGDGLSLFNKVYGSDSLRRELMHGSSPGRIAASWRGFEESFKARRQRYLLYP